MIHMQIQTDTETQKFRDTDWPRDEHQQKKDQHGSGSGKDLRKYWGEGTPRQV